MGSSGNRACSRRTLCGKYPLDRVACTAWAQRSGKETHRDAQVHCMGSKVVARSWHWVHAATGCDLGLVYPGMGRCTFMQTTRIPWGTEDVGACCGCVRKQQQPPQQQPAAAAVAVAAATPVGCMLCGSADPIFNNLFPQLEHHIWPPRTPLSNPQVPVAHQDSPHVQGQCSAFHLPGQSQGHGDCR